jgi:hypothetical protein
MPGIPPKRDEKFPYKHSIPARRDELFPFEHAKMPLLQQKYDVKHLGGFILAMYFVHIDTRRVSRLGGMKTFPSRLARSHKQVQREPLATRVLRDKWFKEDSYCI